VPLRLSTKSQHTHMAKPLRLRRLKADMALKELSTRAIARGTRIPYATVSQLLNGHRIDPQRLSKISSYIDRAPMPKEAALV
jgi:hypothetical protein